MELGALLYQFKNESALRFATNKEHQGGRRKSDYSDADVECFKYDVLNGMRIIDAAKEHGIPLSTARGLLPKVNKPKDRELAVELLNKRLMGVIDYSYRKIARKSGYSHAGITRIKRELQS